MPDLWLVDLFCPIKKKFHTPPYLTRRQAAAAAQMQGSENLRHSGNISFHQINLPDKEVVSRDLLPDKEVESRDLLSYEEVVSRDLLSDKEVVSRDLLSAKEVVSRDLLSYKEVVSRDLLSDKEVVS